MKKVFFIIVLLVLFGISAFAVITYIKPVPINNNVDTVNKKPVSNQEDKLLLPLTSVLDRVTKKPFGIKIDPGNSPVHPERFHGYHTGVDFEIFPGEENKDVPVYAVCGGQLLVKKWASGYGGVLSQRCKIENKDVTIIYGHLKLSSVTINVGEEITAGEKIAVLGQGYSQETDGERKHLHLGIHKGAAIDLRGYIGTETELNNWIDGEKFLKLGQN